MGPSRDDSRSGKDARNTTRSGSEVRQEEIPDAGAQYGGDVIVRITRAAINVVRAVGFFGHREIATALAKLGETKAAKDHVSEAMRLAERYSTRYQLLTTLVAKADIYGDTKLRAEAIDFARLLKNMG